MHQKITLQVSTFSIKQTLSPIDVFNSKQIKQAPGKPLNFPRENHHLGPSYHPFWAVLGLGQLSLKLLIIRLDLQTLLLVTGRRIVDGWNPASTSWGWENLSLFTTGFIHPRWWISSINRMADKGKMWMCFCWLLPIDFGGVAQKSQFLKSWKTS